eukprot:1139761-Pelagomonas_calceolata.AAC.1
MKEAPEPAKVESTVAEVWAQLESNEGCFRCPEWMKLAELVIVMVPGSVEDEHMVSALKYLKRPHLQQVEGDAHQCVCSRVLEHGPSFTQMQLAVVLALKNSKCEGTALCSIERGNSCYLIMAGLGGVKHYIPKGEVVLALTGSIHIPLVITLDATFRGSSLARIVERSHSSGHCSFGTISKGGVVLALTWSINAPGCCSGAVMLLCWRCASNATGLANECLEKKRKKDRRVYACRSAACVEEKVGAPPSTGPASERLLRSVLPIVQGSKRGCLIKIRGSGACLSSSLRSPRYTPRGWGLYRGLDSRPWTSRIGGHGNIGGLRSPEALHGS